MRYLPYSDPPVRNPLSDGSGVVVGRINGVDRLDKASWRVAVCGTGADENAESVSPTHISLERSEDGAVWLVRHEDTGVATEGETRRHALEMLAEAVAAYKTRRRVRQSFD